MHIHHDKHVQSLKHGILISKHTIIQKMHVYIYMHDLPHLPHYITTLMHHHSTYASMHIHVIIQECETLIFNLIFKQSKHVILLT